MIDWFTNENDAPLIKEVFDNSVTYRFMEIKIKELEKRIEALEEEALEIHDTIPTIGEQVVDALEMAIEALEQEPCEDAISRQAVRHILNHEVKMPIKVWKKLFELVDDLPSVSPTRETVTEFADRCRECGKQKRCKDCRHFEYDSVAKVDGISLIVAHEICKRWGDGCKTREDGYCFLFEPQEERDKE